MRWQHFTRITFKKWPEYHLGKVTQLSDSWLSETITRMRPTLFLRRRHSALVSVSALAMTGTMFTLWCTAFMNAMSNIFNLQAHINHLSTKHPVLSRYFAFYSFADLLNRTTSRLLREAFSHPVIKTRKLCAPISTTVYSQVINCIGLCRFEQKFCETINWLLAKHACIKLWAAVIRIFLPLCDKSSPSHQWKFM